MATVLTADHDDQGEAFIPCRDRCHVEPILERAADWYGGQGAAARIRAAYLPLLDLDQLTRDINNALYRKGQTMTEQQPTDTPALAIPGVPRGIDFDTYRQAMASLGLDITRVRSVECGTDGVYVTVYADKPTRLGSDGQPRQHRVFVPIISPGHPDWQG